MDTNMAAVWTGEVMNAGWWIRNTRQHDQLRRHQAILRMGMAVRAALEAKASPEPILYAVAVSLYDPHNPRFQV